MRVGVNALFIRTARVGGAEPMVHNLVRGLLDTMRPTDSVVVFAPEEARSAWPQLPDGASVDFEDVGAAQGNRFLEESRLLRRFDGSVDVWLHTNYFTPPGLRARSVTVVHDEQFRELPDFFSRKKRLWLQLAHGRTARTADQVICISGSVAEGVRRRRRGALTVIHNPVSWERFAPFVDPAPASQLPVVLAVAAQYPHKRLDLLLRAWQMVEQAHPSARLELVGQTSDNLVSTTARPLPGLARELGLQRVIFRGHVSDDQLGEAYRRAILFAHPSSFEGFGLPVVEALGFAVPVLATDLPVIRELAPHGVSFVDGRTGPQGWAEGLLAGLASPRLSDAQTLYYRQTFSPSVIGEQYWDVFDQVARA